MSSVAQSGRSSPRWRRLEKHLIGLAFVLPVFILFVVFRVWPAINGFLLSLQDYRINGPTTWVGLEHFRFMLQDSIFWNALRVTAVYALIAVPLSITIALGMALLINRALKGISFYRAIYFMPYITSLVMVSVVWSWVYKTNGGLLNSLLDTVNLGPVRWLTSQDMVLPSLAIMATWKGVGYAMMILLAGLRAIPAELGEASAVDGASSSQTFWRVTLPLLKPVLFFVVVIETIGSFQVFDAIFVMTQGGPVRASYSLVYMLYDESFKFGNFSYASAIGVVLFFITFGVMTIQRLMFGGREA